MPSDKTEVSEISVALGLKDIPLEMVTEDDLYALLLPDVRTKISRHRLSKYKDFLQGVRSLDNLTHEQIEQLWEGGRRLREHLGEPQASRTLWSGPRHAPSGVSIPQDISLPTGFVSVKVESHVIYNLSPFVLFVDLFAQQFPSPERRRANWFVELVPNFYQQAMAAYRVDPRTEMRVEMFRQVSERSAQLFNQSWGRVATARNRRGPFTHYTQRIAKVFLRINSAPYYLVALEEGEPVVARVPDLGHFLREWDLVDVEAQPNRPQDRQAYVYFSVYFRPRGGGRKEVELSYRTEIRWSHRQFRGNPEAKLYKRFGYNYLLEHGIYLPLE